MLIAACTAALDPDRIAPDPRLAELADHLTFIEQTEKISAAARRASNTSMKPGYGAWCLVILPD
ncbi:hypothetical protein [Bradyrhizobium lablabi]|uniref:hypothetical protein n=1 Tax=Bradyrhizobium lablabi TaxID=722472 RepID=UPI002012F765|nr:hypothetical protein [Bradyrhizobium lablabi]